MSDPRPTPPKTDTEDAPPAKDMARWLAWPLLAVILAIGVAFRFVYSKFVYLANFDTGTVSYMAVNILKGDRPLFFYGQNYMGALEAYVAALFIPLTNLLYPAVAGETATEAAFRQSSAIDMATSTSTILFAALWIWAVYLLFTEIRSRGSGLVAALLVAIPGYWTIKYSVFPYGGYTVAFFCAIMVLWLAIRLYKRQPTGRAMWAHALGLGAFAAVGVWTHYLVASFCIVAGLFCLVHVLRNLRRGVILPYVVGALVAVSGLLPAALLSDEYSGSHTRGFNFTLEHAMAAWKVFETHNAKRLLFWDVQKFGAELAEERGFQNPEAFGANAEEVWRIVLGVGLLLGFLGYLLFIVRARKNRLPAAAPLLCILVFLALFVPHHLSNDLAPRYIMANIVILTGMCFGLGMMAHGRWWRWLGYVFLLLFIASQFYGQVIHLKGKQKGAHDRRWTNSAVVAEAKATDVDYLGMVTGDPQYMHESQVFNSITEEDPTFVAPLDDRTQDRAEAFEIADVDRIGWICQPTTVPAMDLSFSELGYKVTRNEGALSLSAPIWKPVPDANDSYPLREEIPPEDYTVKLNGNIVETLSDRDIRTTSNYITYIEIEFERPVIPHSLWVTTPDPFAKKYIRWYEVWVNPGDSLETAKRVNDCIKRVGDSYRIGDRVYFKGYYPRGEIWFGEIDVPIKSLAIIKNRNNKGTDWKLNELHLFKRLMGTVQEQVAYGAAHTRLTSGTLDFVISDRQASARLLRDAGPGVAYPRYNTKIPRTMISRIVHPRDGLAVLVDKAVTEQCLKTIKSLYPPECVAEVISGSADMYSLIVFQGEWPMRNSGLVWDGHTVLKAYEPALLTLPGQEYLPVMTLEELHELSEADPKASYKLAKKRWAEAVRAAP